METTYQASTVELDSTGFDDLQSQIINNKGQKPDVDGDIRDKPVQKETTKQVAPSSKKYFFTKGDQSLEVDEDYEIEFMADKRPTKLTLRELKERAAGDIAIKNRMHSLAEEKKRVQGTFKKFSEIAKNDPLGALEYISQQARESDSEFEYLKYIEKLADQAEKLGRMNEEQRKAWELEKKLAKAEQDLSQKERSQAVVLRKQELLTDYPEIGDHQFSDMVDAILSNDELMEGLNNENDVMDKVEELIQETLTQRDIMSVIREINPAYLNDQDLIFSLSDQLRQNPDFEEDDVREILQDLIGKPKEQRSQPSQRERDIQTLSSKARMANAPSDIRMQNSSPYQLLEQQLLERREQMRKTPLYKR